MKMLDLLTLDAFTDLTNALREEVWHGSPHPQFDHFSTTQVGTGEGAKVYGWGLYFASVKEVAEHYRKHLSQVRLIDVQGNPIEASFDTPEGLAAYHLIEAGADYDKARRSLEVAFGDPEIAADELTALEQLRARGARFPTGHVYNVEIPDSDDYLLWDQPLSRQSAKVRKLLLRRFGGRQMLYQAPDGEMTDMTTLEPEERAYLEKIARKAIGSIGTRTEFLLRADQTGETFYRSLAEKLKSDRQASRQLAKAGIPGIKYLDGDSRSFAHGTYNYVIFDDRLVSIKGVD